MIPIIKSIELVEDPALLVGLKSGAFIKLQPQVKLESFPANSTFLGAPRPPFLLLTDFEKEKVRIDTTIEEISGAPFSGNFAALEVAIAGLVEQVNQGTGLNDSEFIDFLQRGGNETFYNPLSIQRVFQTSTTFGTGAFFMYAMYLSKNTEISSITFSKQGLGPANLTMGIYDFEDQGNSNVKFTPKNLILAPDEFVFPTGVVRVQNSFPPFTFSGGWYCFIFNVSTNWRAKGSGLIPHFWGNGDLGTSISMIATLNQAAVYTNVMPDPFPQSPAINPNFSNIIPPVPFFHI